MAVSVSMVEAHEDRIQDLETSQGVLAVDVARLTSDLEHLQAAVEERVVPVIDTIAKDVAAGRAENVKWFAATDTRLTALEIIRRDQLASRALWVGRIRAPFILALTAAAGALAGKFGEALWLWITT